MDHITAEFTEKPDILSWFDDIEGEVNTFAFSDRGPTVDKGSTLEGTTDTTET
jgi:hypothetical protein